jgi:hypothetical protein
MSVVPASFWRATGTVSSPPPGPVRNPPRGPVSLSVHKYEDHHDEQKDAEHKPPIAGEGNVMRWEAAHYLAPSE